MRLPTALTASKTNISVLTQASRGLRISRSESHVASNLGAGRDHMSVEQNERSGDPTATDGQAPDAPARPMMKENDAPNGRHQYLPPEVAMEEHKNAGDPATTDAHDAQAPDPPVRPTAEENVTSDKGQQLRPPGGPGLQRGATNPRTRPRSRRSSARRRSCKESLTHLRRRTRP